MRWLWGGRQHSRGQETDGRQSRSGPPSRSRRQTSPTARFPTRWQARPPGPPAADCQAAGPMPGVGKRVDRGAIKVGERRRCTGPKKIVVNQAVLLPWVHTRVRPPCYHQILGFSAPRQPPCRPHRALGPMPLDPFVVGTQPRQGNGSGGDMGHRGRHGIFFPSGAMVFFC